MRVRCRRGSSSVLRGIDYALLTLHRPSNVDLRDSFERILAALEAIAAKLPIVFPVHPRTRKTIAELGLSDRVESIKDLRLIEPLGYLDFLNLSSSARLVLTDSGGIQEETTALGIPCLTLRENTERPITVEMGTNVVVGTDTTKIIAAANATLNGSAKKALKQPPLWDGHTSERILDALEELALALMPVLNKIKRALRGEVKLTTAAREAWRRSLVSFEQRKERARLNNDESLSLARDYAHMSADELLAHFRGTREAKFFSGLIPSETAELIASAERIVNDHSWPLLGFGEQSFGKRFSGDVIRFQITFGRSITIATSSSCARMVLTCACFGS